MHPRNFQRPALLPITISGRQSSALSANFWPLHKLCQQDLSRHIIRSRHDDFLRFPVRRYVRHSWGREGVDDGGWQQEDRECKKASRKKHALGGERLWGGRRPNISTEDICSSEPEACQLRFPTWCRGPWGHWADYTVGTPSVAIFPGEHSPRMDRKSHDTYLQSCPRFSWQRLSTHCTSFQRRN